MMVVRRVNCRWGARSRTIRGTIGGAVSGGLVALSVRFTEAMVGTTVGPLGLLFSVQEHRSTGLYSAYFVQLDQEMQDEIICRTEHAG